MKCLTVVTFSLGILINPVGVFTQEGANSQTLIPRVGSFDHLIRPRITVSDEASGLIPLRQFCPEEIETCRKYWDYTINFVSNYSIPLRDKELIILRTAWLSRGDYIWGRHNLMGREAGLTEDEIARVTKGPDAPGWNEFDALLLRSADELHLNRFISHPTWAGLASRYSQQELREVVLIVGNYTQLAMFQNTLGVQLPAEIKGLPDSEGTR